MFTRQLHLQETRLMIGRQDGRVGGLELTSSYGNTKITTNYWATIDKKDWKLSKKIFTHKDKKSQRGSRRGTFCNAIKWATHKLENNYIAEVPCQVPQPGGLALGEEALGAFGVESQWDLSAEVPQDWGKERLHSWRVHTKFHMYWATGQKRIP